MELLRIDKKEFGEFISFMRKAAGISKANLASEMGVSPMTITRYEKGERLPRNIELFDKALRQLVKAEIKRKRLVG